MPDSRLQRGRTSASDRARDRSTPGRRPRRADGCPSARDHARPLRSIIRVDGPATVASDRRCRPP
jgi:hypothetical protein